LEHLSVRELREGNLEGGGPRLGTLGRLWKQSSLSVGTLFRDRRGGVSFTGDLERDGGFQRYVKECSGNQQLSP
jgi:hypothetical protein